MFSLGEMQSTASGFFSAYASLAATMMLFRSMASDIIPPQFMSYLTQGFNYIFHYFFPPLSSPSNIVTITIEELIGMTPNQIFESAEIYLGTKVSPDAQRFKVSKTPRQNKINVTIQRNEEVNDSFKNIPQLTWLFASDAPDSDKMSPEKNYFELSFDKKYKEEVVNEYLPFVIEQAKEIKGKDRAIRLYTRGCSTYDDDDNSYGSWGSIKLEHPSTFDTLAMEPDMKKAVIDDIERFLRRKDFYKKVGKAWKRGYLLYGPPGTGKSSLVAAMANYLKFDIYDVELSSLYSNSELRDILVSTKNRSIIVIEDIDCSVETHDRSLGYHEPNDDKKFTLSGLLNFIDGLWSSCGDEKIIVFTTNHKDKLDPALLRPGRMDMHIHMSYCTFNSFKTLAFNYLGINDYPKLFAEIKELIENVQITPAEIAEELMRSEIAEDALQGVVNLLLLKQKTIEAKADAEAAKAKVNQVDDAKSETPEANVDEEEEDLDEFEKWK